MNIDILSTRTSDGIAVITLGSAKHIYFDAEMSDALTQELEEFAGDPNIRVVSVTGGAPGYFNRHFSIPALIELAEAVRASGRQWPDNATYHVGFFDKAMALCETMPKPVIAAISGTALAGAFEFTLACDLRIAEDGDYLIGLPETELGLLPGAGGTQRLPRTIGPAAALHAHSYRAAAQSAGRRKERPCARNRQWQGHRSRDGDRKTAVLAYAGIARLHQASRPQCDRHASR
jgi:enoyl-CoA hydratase/carnithine racemase